MPFFTKKPVQIEARQFDGSIESGTALFEWITANGRKAVLGDVFVIVTLEGDHRVSPDDWVIKGVQGEFYPCKPDIFDATYEPA